MKPDFHSLVSKVEKLSLRLRVTIFAGTILILAGIFTYFVYLPKSEEIALLEDRIGSLEMRLAAARKTARNLEKFKAEMIEVQAMFDEALNLLPNEREIPTLLRSITQMGNDSNLDFHLFKPEREVPKDFYIEIPVSIEVSGNFVDVLTFFDRVGAMERIVNIVNVSMRPEKDLSTVLKTNCTAVTYRFRGEE